MAARESAAARLKLALVIFLPAIASFACGSSATPKPSSLPPQSVSQGRPTEPPPPAAPSAPLPAAGEKKATDVVVIEPGGDPEAPAPTLAEAARAEKARRSTAAAPVAVIDNKTLAEYAKGQKLTVGAPEEAAQEDSAEAKEQSQTGEAKHDETWWRTRARDIRERWHDAAERVTELEAKANDLRRKFYATDDPYVRDSQVKPAWDRAIEDLENARRDVDHGAEELQSFLDDGHRAGVLPGWLREGIELEPVPPPEEAKPSTNPSGEEPPVAAEPPPARLR